MAAAAMTFVVALTIAACGGGGGGASLKCSGDAAAAGLGDGTLCADSNFRVAKDDFSFQNWAGVRGPTEVLTAATFVDMYGAGQVCASGSTGADCVLTPVAEQALEQENQALAGGRCEGLATLSMRYFLGLEDVAAVESGVKNTTGLVRPQAQLDSRIGYWWATQFAPEVQKIAAASRTRDPVTLVGELAKGLAEGSGYTIGIYGDGFGHAVTPFAVSKRADAYVVHVYDNNAPGVRKEIVVDSKSKTWSFAGGAVNPDGTSSTWTGTTGTFELTPMSARQGPFTGEFASSAAKVRGNATVRLTVDGTSGAPAAGLLVTTSSGKQFGIVDGQLVSGISGGSYTVGKGGLGSSVVEVQIPDLEETYAVQPVSATEVSSNVPLSATLSLRSADGTSTFVQAEVPLAAATKTSDPATLGTALQVAPGAAVTVDAKGPTSVTVATNTSRFEAKLTEGQKLTTSPQEGGAGIQVKSATGEVLTQSSVSRTDVSPSPTAAPSTTAPTTSTTAAPTTTVAPPTTMSPPTTAAPEVTTTTTAPPPPSTTTTTAPPAPSTTTTTAAPRPSTTTTTAAPRPTTTTTVPPPADPHLGVLTIPSMEFGDSDVPVTAPTSRSNGAFTWSSSVPDVATIDPVTGIVQTQGVGETTITVTQAATARYTSATVSTQLVVSGDDLVAGSVNHWDLSAISSVDGVDNGDGTQRVTEIHDLVGDVGLRSDPSATGSHYGAQQQNGLNYVTDGGQPMTTTAPIGFDDGSMALVLRSSATTGQHDVVGSTGQLSVTQNGGRWRFELAGQTVVGPAVDTNWHVISFSVDGRTASFWVDGTMVGSVTAAQPLPPLDVTLSGGSSFSGDLAEAAHYSRALTGEEHHLLSTYLSTKWGFAPTSP